jgi:hypothetical protein
MASPTQQPPPRSWFLDALSALAFGLLSLLLAAATKRALGPIPALLVFAVLGGTGYFFGKSAWRGLLAARGK